MRELHVFAPALGTISPSPFSVKALLLLEMSGLPYRRRTGDPRKAPRGKLPVLVEDGVAIPDSEGLLRHLSEVHGFDPDAHLSHRQRAEAAAIRALVEDHLYWALVHSRWIERPDATRAAFFGGLPAPLRRPVFALVRRQVARALHGQGMGRFPAADIHRMGAEGVSALAALIGEGPFVFGDRPSSIDAVVFGFLENVLQAGMDTPLKAAAGRLEPLLHHHRTLRSGLAAPLVP